MAKHSHPRHPWRVRVNGHSLGAGVLLDEWNVLTCAHVTGDENQEVEIQSTVCRPEWRTTARVCPGPSGDRKQSTTHPDPLHDALTRELRRLLTSEWAGTVVLPGTTDTGTTWLARLVPTNDPATRGTVPPPCAIDVACDARGKPTAEIKRYLAEGFGISGGEPDLVRRLLRRQPPVCIVIDSVDRAESPAALIREVLRPLAAGARSRGMRLVLGFDSETPRALPYEVSLDPGPIAGGSSRSVSAHDAEKHVRELADAEEAAARINGENESRFSKPPRLPRARAPRLRVRLAVARTSDPNVANPIPELAAIDEAATIALGKVTSFLQRSGQLNRELEDLRYTLEVHRIRADRHWHAEDQPFGNLRDEAARALWRAPIDIAGARELVQRYEAEINSHIDGGDEEDRG
jgi:hypothetical protein